MSDLQTAKIDELFRRVPQNSGLDPRLIEEAKIELNLLKTRAGAHVQTHKQKSWSKTDTEQLQDKLRDKDIEILLLKRQLQDRDRVARGQGESNSHRVIRIKAHYKQLFEQEWGETYGYFKLQGWNEIEIIVTLQRILRASYSFSQDVAHEQFDNIAGEGLYPSATWMDDDGIITRLKQRHITREIAELAKLYQQTTSQDCLPVLQKIFIEHVLPTFIDPTRYSNTTTQHYTKQCVDIAWSMCVQDPPMIFLDKLDRGAEFNNDVFRKYTDGGNKFDYLVWPAMFLHHGGPLVAQGIAQPIKSVADDIHERLSNNADMAAGRTPASPSRYSRVSQNPCDTICLESPGRTSLDRFTPQTPQQTYVRAPNRSEIEIPKSPYFDPHTSRTPATVSHRTPVPQSNRSPRGSSTIPGIYVAHHDDDRRGRYDTPDTDNHGNLTVLWKKNDDRLPSAP